MGAQAEEELTLPLPEISPGIARAALVGSLRSQDKGQAQKEIVLVAERVEIIADCRHQGLSLAVDMLLADHPEGLPPAEAPGKALDHFDKDGATFGVAQGRDDGDARVEKIARAHDAVGGRLATPLETLGVDQVAGT
jgi:hypothetical protein